MKAIKVQLSLLGSDPLIFREVLIAEDMPLSGLHELIQLLMDWDDYHLHHFIYKKRQFFDDEMNAYFNTEVGEWLPRKGSKFGYMYDFGDSWEIEIESLGKETITSDQRLPDLIGGANAAPPEDSGGIPGYYYKLEVLADPKHTDHADIKEWMGPDFDPNRFDLESIRLAIAEVDWDSDEDFPALTDLDAGKTRRIAVKWLADTHGIHLTEENNRNVPQEIIDFLAVAEAEDDPAPFVAEAERLRKKYPEEITIAHALALMYGFLEENSKAQRIIKNMPDSSPDHVLFNLRFLMMTEDDKDFNRMVKKMPQPLDINNLPPGKDGRYQAEEFLLFEDIAIRYALNQDKLEEAVSRLDRLVQAGFLHADVYAAAMAIAVKQVETVQALIADSRRNPGKAVPPPSKPVHPRTQEILDAAAQDLLSVLNLGEDDDFFAEEDDWEDEEDFTDFLSAGKPKLPTEAKVIGLDPFRHLGRNDRIRVRDTKTGVIQENVKFKLVEARLRKGELELL